MSFFKNISLQRITSTGNFIPEIDGLRFLAIISVLIFHLNGFLLNKLNIGTDTIIPSFFKNGYLGVEVFFVISGFVLALPFVKVHILKTGEFFPKKYFIRRLTRLEPPYIIIMFMLFIASTFLLHKFSIIEGVKTFFSSIFYSHNFIYGRGTNPLLNTVAWSLEVEVQFYILAPIIAFIYKLNKINRRGILVLACIIFSFLPNYLRLPFVSLYDYIEYFLLGFLLADFYLDKENKVAIPFSIIIGISSIIIIFSLSTEFDPFLSSLYTSLQLGALFILFHIVLMQRKISFFSKKLITNIGGMCYTIYLIHYPIISIIGNVLVKIKFTNIKDINYMICFIILMSIVLIISGITFLILEKPFMDKNWVSNFKSKLSIG